MGRGQAFCGGKGRRRELRRGKGGKKERKKTTRVLSAELPNRDICDYHVEYVQTIGLLFKWALVGDEYEIQTHNLWLSKQVSVLLSYRSSKNLGWLNILNLAISRTAAELHEANYKLAKLLHTHTWFVLNHENRFSATKLIQHSQFIVFCIPTFFVAGRSCCKFALVFLTGKYHLWGRGMNNIHKILAH